jgi:hypothetical protein
MDVKIQDKDIFHGAAFTQIVEHPSFKALNRATDRYGHYQINQGRFIFMKYSKATKSPWSFSFSDEDVEAIKNSSDDTFVCLVCGKTTVCALNKKEIAKVLAFNSTVVQFITVKVPPGGSCHVHGTAGDLGSAVPHNSFPNKLFPAS